MEINKQQATMANQALMNDNDHNESSYRITANDSLLFSNGFSDAEKTNDEILDLFNTDPHKALELLLVLTKKHDDEPMLASHLADAYDVTGNKELAQQTVRDNYRRFPHFSIIRCEYAELCLAEDKIMEAASALDYTFDITDLYPKKSIFHIIEIIGFQAFLTKYFCAVKDFNRAVSCIDMLVEIHEDIPAIKALNTLVLFSVLKENLSMKSIEKIFTGIKIAKDE